MSIRYIISIAWMIFHSSFSSAQDFWEPTGRLDTYGVFALAVNTSGDLFAGVGDSGGVFRSTDNGESWMHTSAGLPFVVGGKPWVRSLAINDSGYIFAGTHKDGLYRSTDNGNAWSEVGENQNWGGVWSFAIDSDGQLYAGAYSGVFRSNDNGDTWKQLLSTSALVISLAIDSNGFIFAGTFQDGVYRSTDDGESWIQIGLDGEDVAVYLSINSAGHIFAGTGIFFSGGSIYRSTNHGDSWTVISDSLHPNIHVNSLAINAANDVFVGTNMLGAFFSTDNGNSWTEINNGLPGSSWVLCFVINPTGHIFAGTYDGVYRSVESTLPVREISGELPITFSLSQNYPNPFNPRTTVEYELPKSSEVSLIVYNLVGEKVTCLVEGEMPAGMHTINWDASNFSSGIYFYRLRTEDFVQTRKMLLLK